VTIEFKLPPPERKSEKKADPGKQDADKQEEGAPADKIPDRFELTGQRPGATPALVSVPYPSDQKPRQMHVIRLIVTLICCYICISLLLQTKDEFRFIIPYVEFSKQVKGGKPLVLDTSVIIDGRIADICDTRFIDAKLIVPRFVLQELQGIADS